ncbi:ABC transporter substrate-binding protein [Tsukamurella sp. 8F]|uniref:peptide ABC transporter substrate-binding protein n=1 Tax=unclassified Tsukamurella TaxID=2633480 RepID=UPI0023BA3C20|nr:MULTISPECIES: ABC transporter substrate-binding protein [unclassified Tsukamurella]MDF0529595.1 ABC transporter substrate-binding protein [Tsukamurella sp. 8J]MDF0585717.1 ABC transporter substrate-binding protein [Tsukamurella sp. 8F]
MRAAVAVVAVGALALTGCSTAGSGDGGGTGSDAIIKADGSEPQNGLVPTNTAENEGGRVVDALFTGLYAYKADGTPELANAESVDTKDNQNFTVHLKKDWKFTDGTPVKAENYVKAWNFGADPKNAQLQHDFFAPIDGYEAVNAPNSTVHEMSGLKVVDDYTFTVKLTQPNIDFKLGLGFTPFKPVPDVFFKEGAKEFGEHPVGNGQYKLSKPDAWQHSVRIDLVKNADYKGPDAPKNGGLSFIFYSSFDTAYSDLQAGNLDVLWQIPQSAYGTFKKDLGDRALTRSTASDQQITIPYYLPHFSGQEGKLRRQAISLAINRPEITKTIFQGLRTPSKDFTARGLPGWSDSIPGNDVLDFNPNKAKQLWAQANAISPWSGALAFSYNSDGDHKAWIDAVSNQLKNTLGIDAHGAPTTEFKQIRDAAVKGVAKSPFRSGWQGDYPSMIEFLGPQYTKGAGSNDARYDNPAFDAKLRDAEQSLDPQTSYKLTNEAQAMLLADLPVIPLWDYTQAGGTAQGVKAELTWNGLPDYPNVTKS